MQHLVWEIDVGFLLMSHLQCLPLHFQMKTFFKRVWDEVLTRSTRLHSCFSEPTSLHRRHFCRFDVCFCAATLHHAETLISCIFK